MEKEKKQTGFIGNIINSFYNNNIGFSGRKLTALFCVLYGAYLAKDLEGENRLHACYAFLSVALLCLGIVTVQNILDFKNGKENNNTNSNVNA
jgi:hypothetical protein